MNIAIMHTGGCHLISDLCTTTNDCQIRVELLFVLKFMLTLLGLKFPRYVIMWRKLQCEEGLGFLGGYFFSLGYPFPQTQIFVVY